MIYTRTLFKRLQTLILAVACCFFANSTYAQFGVAYYQSDIQFIGLSYEINDRFRPEISFGVDQNLENVPLMLDINYDIINKVHYELYAGLGVAFFPSSEQQGITIPIGLNIFPFEQQRIGVHIEALPTLLTDNPLLLGSWGIRYQFGKDK